MLKWKSYTVVIKLQCLHSVDFMAGIFHLLLFRDQIISIASWYMLGVTCSFYFSVNVGSCGLLGHSIVYCHEVIKPPNQQKPERALRRSNIQQCQLYMIHFPRNLFNLMQMSFKKNKQLKAWGVQQFNVSFRMWRYTTTESSSWKNLLWSSLMLKLKRLQAAN